ncbi:SpdD protein [Streptomyces sp. KM273126]|uniref:SpdD protein n=1 Tax=Streptomyces sp. KM273126 TaxID=2545247 RepID=UPI0010399FF9|nr:SpdD protein [Streptomyces sp. KM273126]MBA2807963.1 SpdD protein [Streptomyces sp. KM273126]
MFLPKYPDNPTPPPTHTRTTAEPTPMRRPVPQISVSTGAVAAVLVGGVVLTALLAAVAVTAVSVAVAAVVLRSMLRDQHRR